MNDLPHVPSSGRHWTLCNDVGLCVFVALHENKSANLKELEACGQDVGQLTFADTACM